MSDRENETAAVSTPNSQPIEAPGKARDWAVFTHLSAFSIFIGIPSVVGPLVMWLIKKDQDPYADFHGKEAINFNLSFLLYGLASAVLLLVLIGFVLLPAVFITWFVLVIIGTVKASNGEYYRYPFTIRFIS